MKRPLALLTAMAILVAACTGTTSAPGDDTVVRQPQGDGTVLVGGYFQEFTNCDSLLDYYVSHAVEIVGPWGFGGGGWFGGPVALEGAAVDTAASGAAGQDGFRADYSNTNVQVEGVDEGDIVKTDGKRIFTLADTGLQVAVVTTDGVEFTDQLRLDWYPQSMLLYQDTLVLMGVVWSDGGYRYGGGGYGGYGGNTTKIMEVDVSDPADVSVTRTLEFDGSYVSARLVGSELRVAVNSSPVGLAFEQPSGSGIRAERDATEANQKVIKASDLDNWLPYFILKDGSAESEGRLLDCTNVMAPTTFAGIDTLSLLTFDLNGRGVAAWNSAGVVATGATMYANEDHTYLATGQWQNWAILNETDAESASDGYSTDIHLFDSSGSTPRYVGSGTVKGFLLNQFAMDEFEGHLRVASTTTPNWWGWSSFDSQSQVTVFEVTGGDLNEVGFVDGLGKTEQIQSVRFMGDTAYVVTFRQTDPLYVVDLADPADPSVAGELKIPGYSAYLHPVGEGRLLGVGQAGNEDGQLQGTQMSLFDVSDPANPKLLDTVMVENAWSAVEGDHHAFTLTNGVAYAPFESWLWEEKTQKETFDTGVMAVTVNQDSLDLTAILRPVADGPIDWSDQTFDEAGIAPDPSRMGTRRTIRIDDRLYLITNGGIAVFDVEGFKRVVYTQF